MIKPDCNQKLPPTKLLKINGIDLVEEDDIISPPDETSSEIASSFVVRGYSQITSAKNSDF